MSTLGHGATSNVFVKQNTAGVVTHTPMWQQGMTRVTDASPTTECTVLRYGARF